jgi:hypothetical protein
MVVNAEILDGTSARVDQAHLVCLPTLNAELRVFRTGRVTHSSLRGQAAVEWHAAIDHRTIRELDLESSICAHLILENREVWPMKI